jgi:hypothetical protein
MTLSMIVIDAHENAVGDAIARALPAESLLLVLKPYAFRAEHEGDHPVFVPEVWDLARVALHPRWFAHLGRTAYREPHRVLASVFKMLVSDAAGRKRTKTKADVSSAYTNAKTTRGKRFLRCPATCQQFDEDGTPLVLELGPPLFGEPEAGYEWQATLEADLKEFGWTKVENVECLWHMKTAKSDALLGTIVDDLLVTESERSSRVHDRVGRKGYARRAPGPRPSAGIAQPRQVARDQSPVVGGARRAKGQLHETRGRGQKRGPDLRLRVGVQGKEAR